MPIATSNAAITIHGINVTCSYLSLVQVSGNHPARWPNVFTASLVEVVMALTVSERPLAASIQTAARPAAPTAVAVLIGNPDNRDRTTCTISTPPVLTIFAEFRTM